MFTSMLDLFFGCWHQKYSFPISSKHHRRSAAAAQTGTYVVCLDCGKEFPYDWEEMKVVSLGRRKPAGLAKAATFATK